jgi:NCAIR mutase (PurE)-related protein
VENQPMSEDGTICGIRPVLKWAVPREKRFKNLHFARVEPKRFHRQGFPEAIFCPGKTVHQILEIFGSLLGAGGPVLATRITQDAAGAIVERFPKAVHHPEARIVSANPMRRRGRAAIVISAGTADLPVAEESAITLETLGIEVIRLFDVGVAGLHRLIEHEDHLRKAAVCVVCAGMDGALPSVVGGLAACPVIAVPTSVGYGANLGGIASLLTMLNSCAANVTVVNIDNGFGAGVVASLICAK